MQTIFNGQQAAPGRRTLRFWLLILSPVLVIGMGVLALRNMRKTMNAADREVTAFRQEFEAGQLAVIYDAASPGFRSKFEREHFFVMLSTIHGKMGACSTPRETGGFVNTSTSGTRVRVQTVSRCSNGELRETFTYVSGNYDRLRLADYDASSAFSH